MKKLHAIKLLSLLLLASLLLPALGMAVMAETVADAESSVVLWEEDFEDVEAGTTLTNSHGYSSVIYVNKVADLAGSRALLFPLVASDASSPKTEPTNVGKFFSLPHPEFPTDKIVSIKARFYPHFAFGTQPNIGLWFQTCKYTDYSGAPQTQKWVQIFNVDLRTGELILPSGATATGEDGLTLDAWNDVEVLFNPVDGSFKILVNDALYASAAIPVAGYDFKVPQNHTLFVSNGNNAADGVASASDLSDYETVNYLAADDWCLRATEAASAGESAPATYAEDFEDMSAGATPAFPASSASIANKGTIVEDAEGKYWSIPFSGEASSKGKINVNQNAYVNNPIIHHDHARSVIFSATYVIPEDGVGIIDGRVGKAICTFTHSDGTVSNGQQIVWLNLWRFSYSADSDEVKVIPGGANTGSSYTARKSERFTITATVDMKSGAYTIAVNGDLAITDAHLIPQYNSGGWHYGKLQNLTILPGEFIVVSPHSTTPTDVDSWIGVESISIAPSATVNVTVNGEERELYEGEILDLTTEGKTFLWASVTEADGTSYVTYEKTIPAKEGLSVNVNAVSLLAMDPTLRVDEHLGIRFLSKISTEDYEALLADPNVKSVTLGTTVAPNLYKGISPDVFSPDAFVGMKQLHFPAKEFYTGVVQNGYSVFAASIVDIKEANYNLGLSGVGYLRIELGDEENTVLTVYTSSSVDAKSVSFASLADKALLSGLLTQELVEKLSPVAAVYAEDMTEIMRGDLEDLDVLALGDSTFWGDAYAWEYQWINWLARECGWALSNISAGGESISYRPTQNQSACVDRLFNESEYKFGGTNSSSAPYRYTNEEALGKSEEDVDLILISYGHNDFGGASIIAPQGEISIENRDTTTYVGAWNVVLEELLERYPNAKIVIVNQWHLTSGNSANEGLTREEYYHAVVEMYYEYYHEMDRIYLLDAGDTRISGVNMNDADFRARYSRTASDPFHLNRDGMEIMKDAMLPYLWNLAVRELEEK